MADSIEAYPKLTEVGGFRTEVDGQVTGGFYTKENIQDIVQYASERHVTVIPEIEMPGHCRAALAAYPWLGCTGDSLPVPSNWGVFKDVYCAGNDSTMAFMKAVLDEVCNLFPSDVIHIGGDEVPKVRWAQCPKCQAKMKRLGLEDEAALQTAFINEMGTHVAKRGKRIMGGMRSWKVDFRKAPLCRVGEAWKGRWRRPIWARMRWFPH